MKKAEVLLKLPDNTVKTVKVSAEEVDFVKEVIKQEIKGGKVSLSKAFMDATGKRGRGYRNHGSKIMARPSVQLLKENMSNEYRRALIAECEVEEYAKEVTASFKTEEGAKKVPGLTLFADIMGIKRGNQGDAESAAKHIYNTLNFYST